jgi:ATP-dependent Clp protease, protease subunit
MGIWDYFRNSEKKTEPADSKLERANQILDKLLADRIIFLGTPIDDVVAERIIAEMLYLDDRNSTEDINFYLNSPGGAVTASFAIYDTIKSLKSEVTTICVGKAIGTACILLAGGVKGKRFVMPSGRVSIHHLEMNLDDERFTVSERLTRIAELERMKKLLVKTLTRETKLTPRQIYSMMQSDRILSATEAIEAGFADAIVTK